MTPILGRMGAIVGRAAELAEIDQALAEAQGGHGRLLLISGPAGIGKSRLADAAVERAGRRGMPVARGYAVDDAGAPPLWPWLRLLRGRPGADSLPTADADESDATARFRLFVAVTDLLQRAAEPAGLLVVLEDCHWAARASVRLLRQLAAELGSSRLAVVVTCRAAVPGPLQDALPDLLRGDAARPLTIGGLGSTEVAAWLPQLIGRTDEAFAATLRERTGGNPLLIRLVAAELASSPGSLDALMAERPQLRRLVAARVAPLTDAVRELVDAASVLGERVDPEVLSAMTGHGAADVRDRLEEARAAGALRDVDGLAFEHALVRDAVYGELSPARRAGLHRSAARALELRRATVPGSIAMHWLQADGADAVEQCLVWAQRADDHARSVLAFDDAARFAQLAVDCARKTGAGTADVARLLVRLAEAQVLEGYVEASVRTCLEAADLAEAAGRADLLAAAGMVIHGFGHPAVHQAIPGICERALASVPATDHAVRAQLMAQLAVAVAESEGGPRAGDLAAAALTEAERSGDPAAILEAISARHLAITVPDTVVERLELGRRAVELGATAQQPIAALWGHLWRADAAFQLGNLAEVEHELAEIDSVARRRGSPLARWHHHRYDASRAALIGDFAAARAADQAAVDLGRRVGDISLIGMTYAFRGELARIRGDAGELPPDWEAVMTHSPQMPLVRVSVPVNHALQGRTDEARAEFEEFRHLPASFPVGVRWAATVTMIGMAAVLLDDDEVAAAVFELLVPTARYYSGDGSGAVFSHGANARVIGDLARVAGRADDALGYYRDAVSMNARIGARPYTALSRLGWAQTLVGMDRDPDQAAALVGQAAAEFRRLDMPGPLATATDLITQLEAARRTASPLSAREREVAELVARALSNREIADRLVLSERTVETHVRNILGKLGFTTRTEIATWLVRTAR